MGPPKTYYTSRVRVRVNADRGVLVAPRGPNGEELAEISHSLGPRAGPMGPRPGPNPQLKHPLGPLGTSAMSGKGPRA